MITAGGGPRRLRSREDDPLLQHVRLKGGEPFRRIQFDHAERRRPIRCGGHKERWQLHGDDKEIATRGEEKEGAGGAAAGAGSVQGRSVHGRGDSTLKQQQQQQQQQQCH